MTSIAEITGPHLWRGEALARHEDWIRIVEKQAVAELAEAVAEARRRNETSASVDIDRHDYPGLARLGQEVRRELRDGTGFCLLRGLPVEGYSVDELKIMLLVLGRHTGLVGPQQDKPRSIGEVMDTGPGMPKDFYFHRGGALPMHMDPIDVVGLLCVRKAKQGGESGITASMSVHNELLRRRPDLLELLYRGFPHIRRHDPENRGRKLLTDHRVPVFADIGGGETICSFLSEAVWAAEKAGLLTLSAAEREAVETMERTAERSDLMLAMNLQPGDLQFLNNRVILHNRLDYEDWLEPDRRRLMLRLWLTIPGWRKYPPHIPQTDVETDTRPA